MVVELSGGHMCGGVAVARASQPDLSLVGALCCAEGHCNRFRRGDGAGLLSDDSAAPCPPRRCELCKTIPFVSDRHATVMF